MTASEANQKAQSIIERFPHLKDPRIQLLELPHNQGRGAARLSGLKKSNGKYLALLDADDWIYSNKLERQVAFLEKEKQIALVSCSMIITDDHGTLKGLRRVSFSRSDKTI